MPIAAVAQTASPAPAVVRSVEKPATADKPKRVRAPRTEVVLAAPAKSPKAKPEAPKVKVVPASLPTSTTALQNKPAPKAPAPVAPQTKPAQSADMGDDSASPARGFKQALQKMIREEVKRQLSAALADILK
ncbi:MAG TPA: hypothetical protein VGP72_32585 [Planctomycetota bacterium]|jgi:hypothetical protein